MLKKSASVVLATLRSSTYRKEYASPLRLLRPCWTVFLSILVGYLTVISRVQLVDFQEVHNRFPQPARQAAPSVLRKTRSTGLVHISTSTVHIRKRLSLAVRNILRFFVFANHLS